MPPTASTPRAEIHTVIGATPSFFNQVQVLAASIRRNAGAFSNCPIIVTVSRDVEPYDLALALPWSERLGVEWRWVDAEIWDEFGMYGSALQRLTYDFRAPYLVHIDADTVCTGPWDNLPELTGERFGGVIAHVSPAAFSFAWHDGLTRLSDDFWHDLYAALKLPEPVLASQVTAWGILDDYEPRRWVPAYYNLGFLAATSDTCRAVGAVVMDELRRIDRVVELPFKCQLAVTAALDRTQTSSRDLSMQWNFPNADEYRATYASAANDIRVVHYMQPIFLDRTSDFANLAALDDFLAKPSATVMNEVLRSTIASVRSELVESPAPAPAPAPAYPLVAAPAAAAESPTWYPFARPLLPSPEQWMPYLQPPYDARWFSNGGPVERRFAERLAMSTPATAERDVALVGSATAGITAALLALEVRGKVAVPAFTFPATIHAIERAGCEPVLCDIDPATWELGADAAREAIDTHGCTAIVHVRAFGLCRDLSAIEAVAREARIPLVIDAAASYGGTEPSGLPVGTRGDAEVFSFHATKVMGIGEGGAVFAAPELVAKIRHANNFAIEGQDVTGPGHNGKLSAFAAAVGLAMLDELDTHINVRAAARDHLTQLVLASGARVAGPDAGLAPGQCLPVLCASVAQRDALIEGMHGGGIEARAYYCPGLHRSTAWEHLAPADLPHTDELAALLVCIPLYADLEGALLEHFADTLALALASPVEFREAA